MAFGSVLLSSINKKDDGVKALVLSPTRELALQIDEELRRIGKYTSLSIVSVFGGSEIEKQIRSLKKGADIVMYGHTHKPMIQQEEKLLVLNPGSLSLPRQEGHRPTYILLELEKGKLAKCEICSL